MLRKRPRTSTTLFAWTVVKTRCPVSAAWTAIWAVSSSRISPTMTLSGSCRRIERRPRAKVSPFFSFTGIWVMPAELVLDRVLDRDDLVLDGLDLGEAGVERRRLARAGRPGDEDHAVRLADELAEPLHRLGVHPEDVEAQVLELGVRRLLVEDPDDGVLAVDRRHDRDAEVDRPPLDADLEAPVLRDPLLGDVELRHDLDAADDRLVVLLVDRLHRRVEDAVDPVLDDDDVLLRLDVDVGRAALDRVEEDRVDELDDRAGVGRDPVDRQDLLPLLVLPDDLHPELFGRLLEDPLGRLGLLQDLLHRGPRADLHPEAALDEGFELVAPHDVRRVGHHDREDPVFLALRDELEAEHPLERDALEERRVDPEGPEVDERDPEPPGDLPGAALLGGGVEDAREVGDGRDVGRGSAHLLSP